MEIADKLKNLRKESGLSQEQLAEKIGVSRQAVTKWETGAGIPDIGNLRSLALLFGLSLDELLSSHAAARGVKYESVTEYDVDAVKRFDIAAGGARRIVLTGTDGEKVKVRLVSDTFARLSRVFKVKIDDVRKRIDVNINRAEEIGEADARAGLDVMIEIPRALCAAVELAACCAFLELRGVHCDVEFGGTATTVTLCDCRGHIELDCSRDMTIDADGLCGRLDINQISATSVLRLPLDTPFRARIKGRSNRIVYKKGGVPAAPFADDGADNVVELAGMNSELTIDCVARP